MTDSLGHIIINGEKMVHGTAGHDPVVELVPASTWTGQTMHGEYQAPSSTHLDTGISSRTRELARRRRTLEDGEGEKEGGSRRSRALAVKIPLTLGAERNYRNILRRCSWRHSGAGWRRKVAEGGH